MKALKFMLKISFGVILIAWGDNELSRLFFKPELVSSWIGPAMIIVGIWVSAKACCAERRGGIFVGVPLLLLALYCVWNMHYWFDPRRTPGHGPPADLWVMAIVLILCGIFFSVFIHYFYPPDVVSVKSAKGVEASLDAGLTELQEHPAASSLPHPRKYAHTDASPLSPWYRLGLLSACAVLAVIVGNVPGVKDSPDRIKVILTVLILGCVVTGLITEKTLAKIAPWKSN